MSTDEAQLGRSALTDRLVAFHAALRAAVPAGESLSSATKGAEREAVLGVLLRGAMPPTYRFGTGDILDSEGRKSGQVDIVLENAFAPSFPYLGEGPRLYLAEGVAMVIEVKSDLSRQWEEVTSTVHRVRALGRRYSTYSSMGLQSRWLAHIPVLVVGYRGWVQQETLAKHAAEVEGIAGILQVEPAMFVRGKGPDPHFPNDTSDPASAIWGFSGPCST